MKKSSQILTLAALSLGITLPAQAVLLETGSASLTINMAALAANTPFKNITGVFGVNETRTSVLADSLTAFNTTTQVVDFGLNPAGITSPAGRSVQGTTLDVTAGDVLGSWTSATNSFNVFLSGGEQIGLGGGLRFTGDYTGVLIFGDFALRYSATQVGTNVNGYTHSGLVLTSNFDFGNAVFADLADATIRFTDNSLEISGDLLLGGGVGALGAPQAVGVNFGTFSLRANTAVVPEPSSYALVFGACAGAIVAARRRRRA